jgi:hypothetical protein
MAKVIASASEAIHVAAQRFYVRASWFETRGVAALLTMRNWQTSS